MSKGVYIKLNVVQSSVSNYLDLYSDIDSYVTPFETNVLTTNLISGYYSWLMPNGTSAIKFYNNSGICRKGPDYGITVSLNPPTPTPTPTPTQTVTPGLSPTMTTTPTNTVTPTVTPTTTVTQTPTVTSTVTPTYTPFYTVTPTPSTGMNSIIQSGLTINVNGTYPSYPGTGTVWYDLQNNYNGSLINGPTWNSGTGGYFSFDGINDYCYFGDGSKGLDTGSRTFGGWVRATTSSTDKVFYFRGEDSFGNGWSMSLYKAANTNKFACTNIYMNGSGTDTVTSTTTLVNNTWYYVVARWTSGTGLSIYVNGVKEATVTHSGTLLRDSTRGWEIARYNGPTYRAVNIGDFELYDRALSDAEVLQNYNTRKSIYGY